MGEEGLLSGGERSTAPGPGQRPLLAVGVSSRDICAAAAVGVSEPHGRSGTAARLVRVHLHQLDAEM